MQSHRVLALEHAPGDLSISAVGQASASAPPQTGRSGHWGPRPHRWRTHRIVFLRLSQIVLPLPVILHFTNLQITTTFYHSLFLFFFLRLNIFISFTCSLNDVISRHVVLIIAFQPFENTLLRTVHSIQVVV